MAYTTIDDPSDYFNTVLYTGTGSEQTVSGVNFQPDWTWLKSRSNTQPHVVSDSVRGATKQLYTSDTQAETSYSQYVKSFNSDGFVLGTDSGINQSSQTFVSWNWKAGTSFTNDASSTGIGSIDSAGSVSTDAGFSIVTYTGTGSAATVAHGLGVAPKMIINRTISASKDWITYHASLGATKFLELNTTDAVATSSDKFNNTEPTSTVFSIESSSQNNTSGGTCLAYCFAEKQGYSKFGSYTGNGSTDGTFFYTGFKPAFTIIRSTGSDQWSMFDAKRNPFNEVDNNIRANSNAAEADQANKEVDYLSNGVKLRTSSGEWNSSGTTYIYMAFAENPFVTSTGVPATAR